MSSKNSSLIQNNRLIKEQLKCFPFLGSRSSSTLSLEILNNSRNKKPLELSKKKLGILRGKSLEIEKKKILQNTLKNFKKTKENIKTKSAGLIKKKRNKTIKQQSFSRVSLISSQNLISIPSTTALNHSDVDVRRLTQENTKYKKIIDNQLKHIKSLEAIIASF